MYKKSRSVFEELNTVILVLKQTNRIRFRIKNPEIDLCTCEN